MKNRFYFVLIIAWGLASGVCSQTKQENLTFTLEVAEKLRESFKQDGRLFLFLTRDPNVEPRTQIWPNPWSKTHIFAINVSEFNPENILRLDQLQDWSSSVNWTLQDAPDGEYYMQVLWDQDKQESRINVPGNVYSDKQLVNFSQGVSAQITLSNIIPPRSLEEHPLIKLVDFQSDTLSKWWNKAVSLKASVLLPKDYSEGTAYPIRYNVAGYGGRYDRINNLIRDRQFMNWWDSGEAPSIISVFLDGEGPFGDCYQMDSENNGPYGYALIHELIPYIENKYRGTTEAQTRFVDGCSTGGWVSLGLQIYYPEMFNGVFSYSPDAVEFENYQLINIYRDANAYINEFGYLRPVMRDTNGEPLLSLKEFIQYENVLGYSDTYLDSGGQFSAHTALYSPKGENGLPKPLFDPETGEINKEVAEHWKKYDFKIFAREHWPELGPKLKGKVFIWMGDMDHFYLNPATRSFGEFLQNTKNPVSDAKIVFSPMEGHCTKFSHRQILTDIQKRIDQL